MKPVIGVTLLFLAWAAEAAVPVVSCTLSRSSGTAPLGVIIDCSATTDADTSKPFHDLLYWHDFGDPNAGTWSNGANTNAPKNRATGPIAAHVYETPSGTPYVITTRVSDGASTRTVTSTVTVADPNDTYSGTATVCFFNSTVGTGCPTGATQTSSSDWDAAIASCIRTRKRCLFKRGDTFTASTDAFVTAAGPNTIGAYGSGAKPIVAMAATGAGIYINNAAVNDLRIMDIDFVGSSADQPLQPGIMLGTAASGVTVLRVRTRLTGSQAISWAPGASAGCSNCIVQDSTFSGQYDGYLVNVRLTPGAVLGNSIGPVGGGTAEGTFRVQKAQKAVVANNTVTTPAGAKAVMTIRSDPRGTSGDDTFHVVISENKLIQGTRAAKVFAIENGVGGDERWYDILVERNWIVAGAITSPASNCTYIQTEATRSTIRNNLVDMSAANCIYHEGVRVRRGSGSPAPNDNNIYNNTFFSSARGETRGVNVFDSAVTNTIVKNNLCWFANGTGGSDCIVDAGTRTTKANNSTTGQTTGTNPSFDGPTTTLLGFRIGTGSYAATAGTAIFPASNDDFFKCDDTTANVRIGALVPRARARCR